MTTTLKTFQLDIDTELVLNADPTLALGAATKQYVDNSRSSNIGEEQVITGTTTLTSADLGFNIVLNSASAFTLNLDPAASLGSDWFIFVKNIGAGTVTVDPSTTETINGGTTQDIKEGRSGMIWSDGTQLRSTIGLRLIDTQTFTASGTYTPTNGISAIEVEGWGAGGGSGGTAATTSPEQAASAAGGGGAYCKEFIVASNLGATETVTIGAGGAAGAAGDNPGGVGGDTTFGAFFTAGGGDGGPGGANTTGDDFAKGGVGGTATGGDLNINGGQGGSGGVNSGARQLTATGGDSPRGAVSAAHQEGTGVGDAGDVPGGGGAGSVAFGTVAAQTGAAGGDGLIIVREYA